MLKEWPELFGHRDVATSLECLLERPGVLAGEIAGEAKECDEVVRGLLRGRCPDGEREDAMRPLLLNRMGEFEYLL
jgi:hypothetical protein